MDLYVIRHAEAVPVGENGIQEDADRPLTDHGREQAKALAAALQRQGVTLDRLVTSPLLRARQTAEELVRNWSGAGPTVEVCDELAPGGKARKLAKFIRDLDVSGIALVGHQPDLSEHVAWLIGGKKAQLDMDKAGLAALRCGEPRKGGAMLMWLVSPAWYGVPALAEAAG